MFNAPSGDDTLAIVAVTETDADAAQRFSDRPQGTVVQTAFGRQERA